MKSTQAKQKGKTGGEKIRLVSKEDFRPEFHWKEFVYKRGDRERTRQIPTIHLIGKKETLKCEGNAYKFLYRSFKQFGDRKIRKAWKEQGQAGLNKLVAKKYDEMTIKHFQLKEENGKLVRMTSDEYVGIEPSIIEGAIEKRLTAEGIEFKKTYANGNTIGEYTLTNTKIADGEFHKYITYVNRNDGASGFKLFGGAKALVCMNGMVRRKNSHTMRLVHRNEAEKFTKNVDRELSNILESIETFGQDVMSLRKMPTTKAQAEAIIKHLRVPSYVQNAVVERLFKESQKTRNGKMDYDDTIYGIYMAMTFVSSHYEMATRGKKKNEVPITARARIRLRSIETLQEAIEKYKAATSKTKAKVPKETKPKVAPTVKGA